VAAIRSEHFRPVKSVNKAGRRLIHMLVDVIEGTNDSQNQ